MDFVNRFDLFYNISGKIKFLEHMENDNYDTGEIMSIQKAQVVFILRMSFSEVQNRGSGREGG